jgi:folate-dependent tRNA-U54 methylase TrmFO/GidA
MNRTLIAQQLRGKIDKWNCINLKSIYTAKATVIRQHSLELKKIFVSNRSDKELIGYTGN